MLKGTKWISQIWIEEGLVQPAWHDASVAYWPLSTAADDGTPVAPDYAESMPALSAGFELSLAAGGLHATGLPILPPIVAGGIGLTVSLWCRRDERAAPSVDVPLMRLS